MRLIYILLDDKIKIEVQQNRNKLSPFIRNKKAINKLPKQLSIESDRIVFQFIKLLNQSFPPFYIEKAFISNELLKIIKNSNFTFHKRNKKSSLKKISDLSCLKALVSKTERQIIVPKKIKILINDFSRDKAYVSFYFDFNEIEKNIPINYDFMVPLVDERKLVFIDKNQQEKLFSIFHSICKQNIISTSFLSFNDLNKLNENDLFDIQYRSESEQQKNVEFISNTLFKLNIYNKDKLEPKQLDFYYSIIENYLQNKSYIDYDGKIYLFDEKNITEDIDNKTLLKVFSYKLNDDIKDFINKIVNISSTLDKRELINKMKIFGFNGVLKSYQEDGVLWLCNLYYNNINGGLLADEMGLGKTVQVIAFLLLSETKNNLIIVPASLVHNWKNEILKFTNLEEADISLSVQDKQPFITILSYEHVRSRLEEIKEIDFDILIVDESQKIKNHKTQIFNAVTQIDRKFTIIMTGTPIENSLNDLWNMLFAINPSLHELYISKIQPLISSIEEYSRAIELTINMLYPVMLQRRKNQVLDLPERCTETLLIDFSNEERKKYDQLLNTFTSALKSGLSGRIHSIALEGLLRLRQYCSIHRIVPQSLLTTNNLIDNKANKVMEFIESSENSNEKIIIFSQFTSSLDELEDLLEKSNRIYLRLDGSTTKTNRNKYVNQFQDVDSNYNIFLISLKAGGVGLNLTSARSAILLEPWWNPAVEEQAFARIDRIGQLKTTKIYRLIYKDSVEEKINTLVDQKKGIFDSMSSLLINRKHLEMEISRDIFDFPRAKR